MLRLIANRAAALDFKIKGDSNLKNYCAPGTFAQLYTQGNEIVVDKSDGMAPFAIIDDADIQYKNTLTIIPITNGMIYLTDQFEITGYSVNAKLYVSPDGKLTTFKHSSKIPYVGICSKPPTAQNPCIEVVSMFGYEDQLNTECDLLLLNTRVDNLEKMDGSGTSLLEEKLKAVEKKIEILEEKLKKFENEGRPIERQSCFDWDNFVWHMQYCGITFDNVVECENINNYEYVFKFSNRFSTLEKIISITHENFERTAPLIAKGSFNNSSNRLEFIKDVIAGRYKKEIVVEPMEEAAPEADVISWKTAGMAIVAAAAMSVISGNKQTNNISNVNIHKEEYVERQNSK